MIATVVATAACWVVTSAPAHADQRPDPAFRLGAAHGPAFQAFGVSWKQRFLYNVTPRVHQAAVAEAANPDLRFIRVPFTPMTFTPEQNFDPGHYRRLGDSLVALKQRRPDIRFYFSRKNYEECPARRATVCLDFPRWMKRDGHVVPRLYGRYVAQALDWIRDLVGARYVPWLGFENEPFNSEAKFTPQRWNRTVYWIDRYTDEPMPKILGTEAPWNHYSFLKPARIDIMTEHSSVKKFGWQRNALEHSYVAARRLGMPIWNSEFHWDHWSDSFLARQFPSLRQMLWQICRGTRVVQFWDLGPTPADLAFRKAVMRSWPAGTRCREAKTLMKGVSVFANTRGRVWVINGNSESRRRWIQGERFRFTRWRSASPWTSHKRGALVIPARSITLIRR